MSNTVKTVLLLGLLMGLFIWVGGRIGGPNGMILAFILAVALNFGAYWYSDKIVLKMYRAREINNESNPELYRLVGSLAQQAGLPMPRVYMVPSEQPNAFATGRNPSHAAVAVTNGIAKLMSREELAGVLAHELAHVKNRDTLIGTIAATMAGAIMMLASMARWAALFGGLGGDDDDGGGIAGLIVLAVITPLAAIIIQSLISQSREYKADATGAKIAGSPFGLADALEKLGSYSSRMSIRNVRSSTAHMMIINPLSGKSFLQLFSTHPPLEKRIEKLRTIG
jgi:heat shock protein HtpX